MKSSPDLASRLETLAIANIPPHRYQVKSSGMLAGFATENMAVLENFRKELDAIQRTVIQKYEDRNNLLDFLDALTRN